MDAKQDIVEKVNKVSSAFPFLANAKEHVHIVYFYNIT